MAETGDLIDFDVIEDSKENIQALPSGRSAKSLASVFSPLAIKSPSNTQDINDAARQDFEKEIESIDDSDDPLDVYDRYCKWTLNAYPTAQATPQSQLLPLLERATKTFLSSSHYKNDPRYLRLWLTYIRFFSDDPRETFAYLSRHGIGETLALFYEEFAAWLESAGRWSQAEEVYKMGIEKDARPAERLMRKFGEFEKRFEAQSEDFKAPGSPALLTVRPALVAKTDPFASSGTHSQDPQAQPAERQTSGAIGRPKKLEIFSDEGAKAKPVAGGSRGWENIGSLAERKKENVVGATPWSGEIMKTSKGPSAAPKMMVFKDPSMSRVPIPRVENHPSLDQKVLNPRTGKLECVAVNLEAVYPDPEDPTVEFCFEELRAAKRGWLQREWRRKKSPKRSPERKLRAPLKESPLKQAILRVDDFNVGPNNIHVPQLVRLNDENDENVPPQINSPNLKHTSGQRREKGQDNKTRSIKVRELKSETQTIQANLDSPQRPRLRRKKSSSEQTATVTLCTKAARDDIYDLFNQTLDPAEPTETIDDNLTDTSDFESTYDIENSVADLVEITDAAGTDEFTAKSTIPA